MLGYMHLIYNLCRNKLIEFYMWTAFVVLVGEQGSRIVLHNCRMWWKICKKFLILCFICATAPHISIDLMASELRLMPWTNILICLHKFMNSVPWQQMTDEWTRLGWHCCLKKSDGFGLWWQQDFMKVALVEVSTLLSLIALWMSLLHVHETHWSFRKMTCDTDCVQCFLFRY